MKKIKHLLVCAFLAFALVAIAKAPVKASDNSTCKFYQSSCKNGQVTVTWTTPDIDTNYTITGYSIKDKSDNVIATLSSTARSCTLTVSNNYEGYVELYANYKTTYSSGEWWCGSATINDLPDKVANKNFGVDSVLSSTKKADIVSYKPSTGVTGSQIQVYKGNKCVYDKTCYTTSDYFSISQNTVYKYRVRYYYKNYDSAFGSGKLFYGPWSSYKKFDFAGFSAKSKSNKKGFTLTVKKVSGISKYTVYVKTSSNGKYKKVKTLKNKNYTVRITSKYKKKASNYIKVVPYISGYGNSDIYTTGTLYVYK